MILLFASGDSLYIGAGLLVLAVSIAMLRRGQPSLLQGRLLQSMATWLGVAMIIMAAPPFEWWIDAALTATFVFWYVAWNVGPRQGLGLVRLVSVSALLLLLVTVAAGELSHRRSLRVRGIAIDHLVVVGDSISAGVGTHAPTWPTMFTKKTGVPVHNLSQAGLGVAGARNVATALTAQDSTVVVEIGGNDLLSGVSAADFSRDLDSLLSQLAKPGRTIVMFELPLLPQNVGYGQAQRRLAKRYGVVLIPKHCFARVLSGSDATTDGLHLSEVGARRMADLVAAVLEPGLKDATGNRN